MSQHEIRVVIAWGEYMSGKDEHAYKIEFNTAIHQIKIEYTYCTLGIARYGNYIHYTAFVILKWKVILDSS